MLRLARTVQILIAESARSSSVRQPDFVALGRLVNSAGMTGVELGRSMSLNASSVTELADRLESARLIKRVRPAHDRRLVILQATPRGRRLVQAAYGPIVSELAELVSGLDDDRVAIVTEFLGDVAAALDPIAAA
jgi:DNA-binding MarR family transcriptional regulator